MMRTSDAKRTPTRPPASSVIVDEIASSWLQCERRLVVENEHVAIHVLVPQADREFQLICVQMRGSAIFENVVIMCDAVKHFVDHTSPSRRAYCVFDFTHSGLLSLRQVEHIVETLRSRRELIRERIVGSMLKMDEGFHQMLLSFITTVYKPTRPFCFWKKPGDAVRFISKQEAEIAATEGGAHQ